MAARELRPLGETLGTEATGIDLSKPLDAGTFAWIEDAFAEHPVLVFRDQELGPRSWRRSAAASAGRRSIRWSITATPSFPRCRG